MEDFKDIIIQMMEKLVTPDSTITIPTITTTTTQEVIFTITNSYSSPSSN